MKKVEINAYEWICPKCATFNWSKMKKGTCVYCNKKFKLIKQKGNNEKYT